MKSFKKCSITFILNYTDSNEVGKEKRKGKKMSEVLINLTIGAVKEQGI